MPQNEKQSNTDLLKACEWAANILWAELSINGSCQHLEGWDTFYATLTKAKELKP